MYDEKIVKFINFQKSIKSRPNTLNAYENSLREFFITYLEEKPIENITLEDIHLFTNYKQDKAEKREKIGISGQGVGANLKGKEIKSTTMNRHFAAIKQFLIFYGYANLAKQVKTLRVQKKFDILDFEDIQKIFQEETLLKFYQNKLKNPDNERIPFYVDRMKLLLDFCLGHGLRLQEVVDLKKFDIKLERKVPVIEVLSGKGNKFREVYLSPTWSNQYKEFLIKYPNSAKGNKLFTNYTGGELSYSTLRTYIKLLGYYINVPNLSFHKLRHCYAIKKYEKTKDIVQLSKSLGHDGIQTTMIYLNKIGLKDEKQVDILI